MATSFFTKGVIQTEKLAILSSSEETNPRQFREFFHQKWETLSQNMDSQTILFIGGAYGSPDGKLSEGADNLENMKLQFEIDKMGPIREDMTRRNIKMEFLDVQFFYKDQSTTEIDEKELITSNFFN